ncbi:MAG: type II toxin-antitoxin system death-on-curing family toxin [archaeon]|nr:type II toxin-antitoxin system death-on-curing family toxin [Nanoarchaeota archaeon]
MVEARVSKEFVDETFQIIAKIHEAIIDESGGEKGIRDEGGLHHSIHKIYNYQIKNSNNPVSVGAFVYKEFARRHHFNDGNKRTAHIYAKIILFTMGFHFKIEYKEAVIFIIKVAEYESKITFNGIKNWISPHLIKISEEDLVKYIKKIILEVK